jgi:hypothetical protein
LGERLDQLYEEMETSGQQSPPTGDTSLDVGVDTSGDTFNDSTDIVSGGAYLFPSGSDSRSRMRNQKDNEYIDVDDDGGIDVFDCPYGGEQSVGSTVDNPIIIDTEIYYATSCVICMNAVVGYTFPTCLHRCICMDCYDELYAMAVAGVVPLRCPLCRALV